MDHYGGIDVSLERSSVCVVDSAGRVVREAKVASEPEALVACSAGSGLRRHGPDWRLARCRSGCIELKLPRFGGRFKGCELSVKWASDTIKYIRNS